MVLSLSVPKSWAELSQDQLRFLLRTMVKVQHSNRHVGFRSMEDAADRTVAQVNTLCFFSWTGMTVICAYDNGWLVRHGESEFSLSTGQVAAAIDHLAWIKNLPDTPVRLDCVDGGVAVPADLSSGFSFDHWLSCETLWQAYLISSDESCLRQMAAILYQKENIRPDAAELLGIFYWWASVKQMVSAMFPNFFQSAGPDDHNTSTPDDLRRNMDAQIRALTKGDITKETLILSMDAMRALTELDAQAREYDELNKKYPKK